MKQHIDSQHVAKKHKKDSFSGLLAACEIDPIPVLSH